ncbi:MAG: hypothetical protein QNJ97_26655 [Myxococcota bacterium]|nr:hypothetical protein [Myxococcota bacterium]
MIRIEVPRVGIIMLLLAILAAGCETDEMSDSADDCSEDDDTENDDSDTGEIGDPCEKIEQGNYEAWEVGDDSFAPGKLVSITSQEGHKPGWERARCHECHGLGQAFSVAGHDPAMDCWAWSCARGFPGGACHGHGPNMDNQFNHSGTEEFYNCTKATCHDVFDGGYARENHGFHGAPDPLCNACHDPFWKGWPEDMI